MVKMIHNKIRKFNHGCFFPSVYVVFFNYCLKSYLESFYNDSYIYNPKKHYFDFLHLICRSNKDQKRYDLRKTDFDLNSFVMSFLFPLTEINFKLQRVEHVIARSLEL